MSQTQGITNSQLLQTTLQSTERVDAAKNTANSNAAAEAKASQGSAGTANLSGAGTLLAAANSDDVRTGKIAALKSAIDSGTYNVPASAVADKLISNLLG